MITADNDFIVEQPFYAANIIEAAVTGDTKALFELLGKEECDQAILDIALVEASVKGHCDSVKLLIEHGATVRAYNDEALRFAVEQGHYGLVKLLLAHGANVHADNEHALHFAASHGYTDIVELLLAHGANVHAGNDYPLRCAAQEGYYNVVRLLLAHGANVHADNDSALHIAAQNGHYDVVRLLLESGANVHAKNGIALWSAVKQGHYKVVKLLLEKGADIHARGDYALCCAAEQGHYDIVILLLSHGAKITFNVLDLKDEAIRTLLRSNQSYPITENLVTALLTNCLKEIPLKGQPYKQMLDSDLAAIIGSYLSLNAKYQIMEPVLKTVLKLNQHILEEIETSWFNIDPKKAELVYCRNLFFAKPYVSGAKIVEMVEKQYPPGFFSAFMSGFFSSRSNQLLQAIAADSTAQDKEETIKPYYYTSKKMADQ